MGPEVHLPEILHPDQPLVGIVQIDMRNLHACGGQETRDVHVVPVLLLVIGVFYQNHRAVGRPDPVKLPVRPALLDGRDFKIPGLVARKIFHRMINDFANCQHE